MIFVEVDTGFTIEDYLIDDKAVCSDIIKELSDNPGKYLLSDSLSGRVLNEDLTLFEQGIISGSRLRLRQYFSDVM